MKTPTCALLLLLAIPSFGQNKPQMMAPNQLRAYLDQVEARLPMWNSNLMELFSPIPTYRDENRDLVALRDSAFRGCREIVSETVRADIPTAIKLERSSPRLGIEIRLLMYLNDIHECVSGTLPFIGDVRTPGRLDKAQNLTQEINPLLLPLREHILAEADSLDARKCPDADSHQVGKR